jgi:hypothetical protein
VFLINVDRMESTCTIVRVLSSPIPFGVLFS